MAKYQVFLSNTSRKQLGTLPVFIHNKIIEEIAGLAEIPRPPGCKKLKGFNNAWRIRTGDYRIVYEVEDRQLALWLSLSVTERMSMNNFVF